jgi:serine/threonine protein kinase
VKPENIRLTDSGHAVLIDLGFAHRPGETADLLDSDLILGTANYLAPEECALKPDADGKADLFSLGVTLFEILTGMLPYPTGTVAETLQAHRDARPARLTNHPPMLAAMVARLLTKPPEFRPHASQVVQNLIGLEIALLQRSA